MKSSTEGEWQQRSYWTALFLHHPRLMHCTVLSMQNSTTWAAQDLCISAIAVKSHLAVITSRARIFRHLEHCDNPHHCGRDSKLHPLHTLQTMQRLLHRINLHRQTMARRMVTKRHPATETEELLLRDYLRLLHLLRENHTRRQREHSMISTVNKVGTWVSEREISLQLFRKARARMIGGQAG